MSNKEVNLITNRSRSLTILSVGFILSELSTIFYVKHMENVTHTLRQLEKYRPLPGLSFNRPLIKVK